MSQCIITHELYIIDQYLHEMESMVVDDILMLQINT